MEQYKEQQNPQGNSEVLEDNGCHIVLHNDDVHTFDYVIKALVDICRHTTQQAEQCAIIVHCRGKCTVKTGGYSELMPMHKALLNKQLSSELIEG
ncbi:MAG: ATP-dependent Clp protease adaptor ClpS [Bacteroidales bacterium]|nr:ATP-dependent Clp protease adaptor ClpS [Bacteroidales bacterium]